MSVAEMKAEAIKQQVGHVTGDKGNPYYAAELRGKKRTLSSFLRINHYRGSELGHLCDGFRYQSFKLATGLHRPDAKKQAKSTTCKPA